jgi:hypothetical protein
MKISPGKVSGDPVTIEEEDMYYEDQKRKTKMQNTVISIGSDKTKY